MNTDHMTVYDYLKDLTVEQDDQHVQDVRTLVQAMALVFDNAFALRNKLSAIAFDANRQFDFQVNTRIPKLETQLNRFTNRGVTGEDPLDKFKTSNESKPHINDERAEDTIANNESMIEQAWQQARTEALVYALFVVKHDVVTDDIN